MGRFGSVFWQSGVLVLIVILLPPAVAQAQNAESFYVDQVEPLVQSICIVCHEDNGIARGSSLVFTPSALTNHRVFLSYINAPTLGAGGGVILASIGGGASHGGGAVIQEASAEYRAFDQYIALASQPPDGVFRAALEEPLEGQVHTGVGNLRGWALASEGIARVEVLIDGQYAFDAPYGGPRGDVGAAFPDVIDADRSGFSLAFNYSDLPVV